MRVIIDTNVLISALISTRTTPPVAIYQAWHAARFDLVTSSTQLDELRRFSRYPRLKSILPAHRIGKMVNDMQRSTVLNRLRPIPDGISVSDPDDAFLLAMALTADADWLVTGDHHAGLLQRRNIGRALITTPDDFCKRALQSPHLSPTITPRSGPGS